MGRPAQKQSDSESAAVGFSLAFVARREESWVLPRLLGVKADGGFGRDAEGRAIGTTV